MVFAYMAAQFIFTLHFFPTELTHRVLVRHISIDLQFLYNVTDMVHQYECKKSYKYYIPTSCFAVSRALGCVSWHIKLIDVQHTMPFVRISHEPVIVLVNISTSDHQNWQKALPNTRLSNP
jgi:hypothetical protein